MKLELKHLAAYLPYGLKVEVEEYDSTVPMFRIDEIDMISSEIVTFKGFSPDWWFDSEENESDIKPVLRPLSDLTEELYYKLSGKNKSEHFGFWYGRYNGDNDKRDYIYHSGYSDSRYFLCDGYGQFNYKMMSFFFANHFDIFGLIENNLAIDVNTLNENPYEK